jgi:hypothetical protein
MFVVHRESENKPNVEIREHESGLHIYDPRKNEELAFVSTVSENKEAFTKRQIKGAETARTLYATLSYPPMKDFKWVIRSNLIKDWPMTVQDVDVAHQIWGKNIAPLKGKTNRSESHRRRKRVLFFWRLNRKASSGKDTRHTNIRYFFITDRVNKEEVSVVSCPTGDMILDYATKVLQGALFRKFRDQIMGVVPARDPGPGRPIGTSAQERPIRTSAQERPIGTSAKRRPIVTSANRIQPRASLGKARQRVWSRQVKGSTT